MTALVGSSPLDEPFDGAIELVGLFEVGQVAGSGDHLHPRIGDELAELVRQFGRSDEILVPDQDQRRHFHGLRPLALVGQPYGLRCDPVSGWIDARHGLDHFPADTPDLAGWAMRMSTRASAMAAKIFASSKRPFVNGFGPRGGLQRCRRGPGRAALQVQRWAMAILATTPPSERPQICAAVDSDAHAIADDDC